MHSGVIASSQTEYESLVLFAPKKWYHADIGLVQTPARGEDSDEVPFTDDERFHRQYSKEKLLSTLDTICVYCRVPIV